MREYSEIPSLLLAWYDVCARELPWRVGPMACRRGVKPDPYHVWLSEIMLQQTTVGAVDAYFRRFLSRWPRVEALAAAEDSEVMAAWAGLGYYARARNLKKTASLIAEEFGGHFPDTYAELITLPGVGPYSAAAIAAIAFDRPETVVDGNVERVIARVFDVKEPLPKAKKTLKSLAQSLTPKNRAGDYAQAVMDLGAMVCTPRNPACEKCPIQHRCSGRAAGRTQELPYRAARIKKTTRYAYFFVVLSSEGHWILEQRPQKGLLGGMLGWQMKMIEEAEFLNGPQPEDGWQVAQGELRHTFTHFHLIGRVFFGVAMGEPSCGKAVSVPRDRFSPQALPSLMRKAFGLVETEFLGEKETASEARNG